MSRIERIIVIDDDPIVNFICGQVIKKYLPGIDVSSFGLPEEGLRFIQTEYMTSPVKTVLLLDINMPTLTGWEVLDELKPMEDIIKEHLRIYIFSSSISIEDRSLSSQHPLVKCFVEKPVTRQKLIDIMMQEHATSEISSSGSGVSL